MATKKQAMVYLDDEGMAKINAADELYVDLHRSTEACDSEYKQRIDFLQNSLLDALGRITQQYPRIDEWDEERVEKLHDYIAWSWAYRNELRLLWSMQHPEHDVTDAAKDWRFVTEEKFGPLPDEVVH